MAFQPLGTGTAHAETVAMTFRENFFVALNVWRIGSIAGELRESAWASGDGVRRRFVLASLTLSSR